MNGSFAGVGAAGHSPAANCCSCAAVGPFASVELAVSTAHAFELYCQARVI